MKCKKCGAEMRISGFIKREEPVTANTVEWCGEHVYDVWRCGKCERFEEVLVEVKI